MSGFDQHKVDQSMTAGELWALLSQAQQASEPAQYAWAREVLLWKALTTLDDQASQMSKNVDAVPKTQLSAQMRKAKLRATSSQALLNYANKLQAQWAAGTTGTLQSSLPALDPTFNDLKSWLESAKAVPDAKILTQSQPGVETVAGTSTPSRPPFVPRMKGLVTRYNGIVAEIETTLKLTRR